MVSPFSVALWPLGTTIVPFPVVLSVPPVIATPFCRVTVEGVVEFNAWIVPPVFLTALPISTKVPPVTACSVPLLVVPTASFTTFSVAPFVASTVPVLVNPLLVKMVRLMGWLALIVPVFVSAIWTLPMSPEPWMVPWLVRVLAGAEPWI